MLFNTKQSFNQIFQQGGSKSKPTNSSLFTTLGTKSSAHSKLSLRRNQSKESSKTLGNKTPPNISDQSSLSVPVVQEGTKVQDEEPCNEPTVIPETQIFRSPCGPQQEDRKNDSVIDLEEMIIPDTPEDSKGEVKAKKVFGRSFLTSAAALGKKPGLTKSELIQKKRLSRARKSLVSISLNNSVNASVQDNDIQKTPVVANEVLKDTTMDEIDVIEEAKNAADEDPTQMFDSRSQVFGNLHFKKCREDEIDRPPMEDENNEDIKENNSDLSFSPVDSATPTKMYEVTIKRMSKSGESPQSKRLTTDENNGNGDEYDVSNKDSVKRNLSGFKAIEKRKKIKPKVSAVNNYQLTMSAHRKNDKDSVSTVDDDVLGELLGEIDSSKSKADSMAFVDESTPLTTLKLKSRKSTLKDGRNTGSHGLLRDSETCISEDDQKLFESLDKEVHVEFQTQKDLTTSCENESKSMTCSSFSMKLKDSLNACQMMKSSKNEVNIDLVATPGGSENLVSATQNIKEYATQQAKIPTVVGDIEEFQSQMDDSLCDGLDALSPFKTNVNKAR